MKANTTDNGAIPRASCTGTAGATVSASAAPAAAPRSSFPSGREGEPAIAGPSGDPAIAGADLPTKLAVPTGPESEPHHSPVPNIVHNHVPGTAESPHSPASFTAPEPDHRRAIAFLVNQLEQTQRERDEARRENKKLLAQIENLAAKPVGPREILRRCRILAGRAEVVKPIQYGRKICALCGAEQEGHYLAVHLRRRHADEVAVMRAEAFV